jgi:hypothetical protein
MIKHSLALSERGVGVLDHLVYLNVVRRFSLYNGESRFLSGDIKRLAVEKHNKHQRVMMGEISLERPKVWETTRELGLIS